MVRAMLGKIDAKKFSEFLDKNRNEPIDIKSLRSSPELEKEAGIISVQEKIRSHRTLEYFLLRTSLYRSEKGKLVPHLISSAWQDYAKAWHKRSGFVEYHIPFRGRITFLVGDSNSPKYCCHPLSSDLVTFILIDTGQLTASSTNGIGENYARYKAAQCKALLDGFKNPNLTAEVRGKLGENQFGRALIQLGLADYSNGYFTIIGNGLLAEEMKKITNGQDIEKVGRIILRREQLSFSQVASVLGILEEFEREHEVWESPVDARPGTLDDNIRFYEKIEGSCSVNSLIASNALKGPGLGFAFFGPVLETYLRHASSGSIRLIENYAFASWLTNSLVHLSNINDLEEYNSWPTSKRERTMRHYSFLQRFVDDDTLQTARQRKNILSLQDNLPNSEIVDFNYSVYHDEVGPESYCQSNVFIASKAPVKTEFVAQSVLDMFKGPSRFRDSQGAYYFPDFRFLLASRIGLSLQEMDQVLALTISKDSKIRKPSLFFHCARRDSFSLSACKRARKDSNETI